MAEAVAEFEEFELDEGYEFENQAVDPAIAAAEVKRQIGESYLRLFNTPDGMTVLKDLKNRYYESTSLDADADWRPGAGERVIAREGRRFVVLQILATMEEALDARRSGR